MKIKPIIIILALAASLPVFAQDTQIASSPLLHDPPTLSFVNSDEVAMRREETFIASQDTTIPTEPTNINTSGPVGGFFGIALAWSTSFNTTNTIWSNATVEISTGTENYNNQNFEPTFDLRVNFLRSGSGGFEAGPEIHNVSDLGSISQAGGQFGYFVYKYDLRFTGELAIGWRTGVNNTEKDLIFEPRAVLEKGMTLNTAMGLSLGLPLQERGTQTWQPSVNVFFAAVVW